MHTWGPSSTPTVAPQSCNVSYTQNFGYHIYNGIRQLLQPPRRSGHGRLRISAVVYRHNGDVPGQ